MFFTKKLSMDTDVTFSVSFIGHNKQINEFIKILTDDTLFEDFINKITRKFPWCCRKTQYENMWENYYGVSSTLNTLRRIILNYHHESSETIHSESQNKNISTKSDYNSKFKSIYIDNINEYIKFITFNINYKNHTYYLCPEFYRGFDIFDRLYFPHIIRAMFPDISIIIIDCPIRTYSDYFMEKVAEYSHNISVINSISKLTKRNKFKSDIYNYVKNQDTFNKYKISNDTFRNKTTLVQIFSKSVHSEIVSYVMTNPIPGDSTSIANIINNNCIDLFNHIINYYNAVTTIEEFIFNASFNLRCKLGLHMFNFRAEQDGIIFEEDSLSILSSG